ncbi:hypothetical protein HY249_01260 [Candidatus Azambacteria bacterium]|nr:hypothetical protein [Candidatus Azambacteria bacterium]
MNEKIGPAFNVKVLKYKNGTAYIKTGNFQLSNEIKLLERSIKRELREEDINLNEIRLV